MKNDGEFVPTKLTLLTILLASTLMLLGGAAVAPALPQIQIAFPDADPMFIDMVITLPPLAIAVSGLLIGMLADRLGKVKVLIPSLLIFAVAGLTGYFLDDLWLLLAGRFFVGIGIAGISACCTALITEYYNGDRRVKILGYQTAAMGIGILFLEIGGGTLAEFGWHEPFLIYAVGLLIFLMALVSVKEPVNKDRGEIEDSGKFNRKAVIACYAGAFLLMMAMFSVPTKLAAFMVETVDASPAITGILLGLNGVMNSAMCLAYWPISFRIPRKYILGIAFTLMGAGLLCFFFANDIPTVLLCLFLVGMGLGLGTTTIVNILSSSVSPTRSGMIMGGYATFLNLGMFTATFVVAALIALSGDLRGMYVSMGAVAVVSAALFFVVIPRVDRA
jgi:MFS family permease